MHFEDMRVALALDDPGSLPAGESSDVRPRVMRAEWTSPSGWVTSGNRSRSISMWCRLVLFALLLTACGPQASNQAVASTARTTPPPQASSATTPVSALAVCSVPAVSWYQAGNPVQLPPIGVQAHYVSYPDGAISAGPADEFTQGGDGFGWRSSTQPGLRGTGPVGYYDVAMKRFLPVPRSQVSPDGRRYVYMDFTQGGLYEFGQLHVVDVSTGHDSTLGLAAAQYLILDFSAEGIYFTYGPYAQSAGLWLLNPDSSATRQVFQDGYVQAIANGKAWIAVNEEDLHPTSPLPGGEGNAKLPVLNVLLRRDLKSGEVVEWLRRPITSSNFELLSAYGDTPAVLVYVADANDPKWSTGQVPYEVWLLPGPSAPVKVAAGVVANIQADPWYRTGREGLGIRDSRGIWLGSDAIYLYEFGKGLTKVAAFPGFPANGCMPAGS